MDKYNHLFDCNLVLKTNNSSYFVLNSNYLNVTNSTMFRGKKKSVFLMFESQHLLQSFTSRKCYKGC